MKVFSSIAVAAVAALSFSAEEAKNRPVSKVITLLKDMVKQLEKEAEDDQEIYDKMACWCTTNDKAKTKAIAEGEARISDLTAAIEEGSAKSAQLDTEIKNLEKEVAKNQQALDKATSMRQKQLAEFNAEEKDLLQSIGGLKSAVIALSKHNSFLQLPSGAHSDVQLVLKQTLSRYSSVLDGSISPSQQKIVKEFMQAEAPAYAPQSGEIFGILKNMKETFEANLENSQKEEAENQKAYEDLKSAKTEEIKSGQNQVDKKTTEMAATDEKLANDKEDLEDTTESLATDEKFLADLKEKCKQMDQEFETRTKTRTEEIGAVSKALEFLNSDEAHDLFSSTFNLVQTMLQNKASAKSQSARSQAVSVLASANKKAQDPRLSTLAMSVKLDAFTKVKEAIDQLVADLKKEKADEIKHRDFCIEGLNENESATNDKDRTKEDLMAKGDELEARVKELAATVEDLKAQVKDAQVQLKRAGEDREKQNMEFQKTVADQRATVKLLTAAMNVLKGFYEKKTGGTAFLYTGFGTEQAPPAGFKSYDNNAGGGGVIGMITQIINDSKAMEAEAIHDEEDAQAAYESFVQETNDTIEVKNKDIVTKSDAKATAEGDLAQAKTELADTMTELEQLANEAADLHKACDFTLKNFDIRQEARDQEVDALGQAKAILSGAK
jgi:chromosome segregation ATPase